MAHPDPEQWIAGLYARRRDVPGALPMRRPVVGDVIAARDPRTGEIWRATVHCLDIELPDSVTFCAAREGVPIDGRSPWKAWEVWSRAARDQQAYVIVQYAETATDVEELTLFGAAVA